MRKLKDEVYDALVKKNGRVWYEYERYVREHMEEHRLHRFRHIRLLLQLNWFYRVKKRNTPYLYWDVPVCPERSNLNMGMESTFDKNKFLSDKCISNINDSLDAVKNLEKNQVSESETFVRAKPYRFVLDLLHYDVISFDIFDTLVFRPFADPKDLFNIVGKRLNYPTVFTGFKKGRYEAEKEARNVREKKFGNREVDIYEIYEQMSKSMGVDIEKGINTEIETELDYVIANPYMKIVFDILKSQGKTIVIVSDMYLPIDIIKKMLDKCGYTGYEKLYVSCEYRCNKASGELFRRILLDYDNQKIVHVGDSELADIKGAKKVGIETRYYTNVNQIGKDRRGSWMNEVTGSAYAGLVNAYLYNGLNKYPFFYEYGFVYGGIYVFGFCNWLKEKIKQEKIDKVVFLSRDGDIYQKVYNRFFNAIDNDYVFWSRLANLKYLIEYNQDAFIDRIIKQKALGSLLISIGSVLEAVGLKYNDEDLKEYGLSLTTILSSNNKVAFSLFIKSEWENIIKTYEQEKENMTADVSRILGDANKIALIDVGWTGSGPLGFRFFVEKECAKKYEILCLMAGGAGNYGTGTGVIPYYLDGTVDAYLFSPLHNKRNAQIHMNQNMAVSNNAVFELFTQTQYPSFTGRKNNGGYVFDIPEVENYEMISQIHKGIMDFCELYSSTYKKDKYLYNIPGFDAYRPFAQKVFEETFFEKNFKEVVFAYGLSGDNKNQKIETIGERMQHYYAHNGGKQ